MAVADIQTSFAAGELSPQLYARVDLAKFASGAALLRNFFVDYRGGVSNRAGTRFCDATVVGARLVPFVVSTSAAYVLIFSNELITIYNQGILVTTVVTPYQTADLYEISYTQSADVLTLVHPSYPPADLSRTSDSTFSYDLVAVGPSIDPPVVTDMVAPHSGPYSYGYLVTSVDLNGKEESLGSNPAVKHTEAQNEQTNRVVGLSWTAPPQGVSRYNIYKWGPVDAVTLNPATVWGFIGSSQTTTFTDNNIAPDFSKQPPGWGDPFSGGQFEFITVATGGAGYDGVSGDWPVIPYVPLTITGDGTGAAGYAVIDHALGTIIGVYLTNSGKNYTEATVTANGEGGTGATFSFGFTDIQGTNPGATAYLQQRRVFGGSLAKPETLVMSQPGLINNFNTTPVTLADDSIVMSIAAEEVNTIKSFVQVSYGLLAFTTGGSFLINGGTPGAAIDANSPSVQAQAGQGANSLRPLRVNYDVLYGQAKGNRIHSLAFAWQKQSYADTDRSMLAAHLFDTFTTVDWCYAEEPFKIVWAVRDDGKLLSLTYVPDQEVYAWCRHDTQGLFKSVVSVPEGNVDAVYVIVERYVPANNPGSDPADDWVYYFERMMERQGCCIFDAWHLDSALGLDRPAPDYSLYLSGTTGSVTVTSSTTDGPRTPDITGIQIFNALSGNTNDAAHSAIDFVNNRVFVFSNSGTLEVLDILTYQSIAKVNITLPFFGMRVGQNGFLYAAGPGGPNYNVMYKIDPLTLAIVGQFGATGGGGLLFDTTASSWACPGTLATVSLDSFQFVVSVASNSGPTNHEIAVINCDTMAWTGTNFHPTESSSAITAGRVGEGEAYLFSYTRADALGQTVYSIYKVAVDAVFPSITLLATLNASHLSAGWNHVSVCFGICFDNTDGNLLVNVGTVPASAYNSGSNYAIGTIVTDGGIDYISIVNANLGHTPASSPTFWTPLGAHTGTQFAIAKINAATGAVMWSVPVANSFGNTNNPWNENSIGKGQLCYLVQTGANAAQFYVIDTIAGTITNSPVSFVNPGQLQVYNDTTGEMVFICDYTHFGSSPVPLGSTPSSYTNSVSTWGPAPAPPAVGPLGPGIIQIGCGKIEVTEVIDSHQVVGTVIAALDDDLLPDDPDGTPAPVLPGDWTITVPVDTLSGLDHLEGKQVWALADGEIVGPLTVASGSVTLPAEASNIVVGLKYTAQGQTLYLTTDGIQAGSDQGKRKQISGVTVRTDCTRGLKAGTDFGEYLTPVPELNEELADGALYTGDARVLSYPQWDRPGQTCFQQDDPLPATVLGVIVEVTPGDTES